jgi:UDP:flavonoid glycosyltransferase YjiC (YdhE family)
MHTDDAAATTEVVLESLRRTGQRGVILTGWGGLRDLPRSNQWFAAEAVPHDWLLPRSRAMIHHGGAGTVAACLRAGIPAVVVPFMADQFFWGRRIHDLGAGPEPISRRQLSVQRLSAAIEEAVQSPFLRRRAAFLGQNIREEDGVERAVEAIENMHEAAVPAYSSADSEWL